MNSTVKGILFVVVLVIVAGGFYLIGKNSASVSGSTQSASTYQAMPSMATATAMPASASDVPVITVSAVALGQSGQPVYNLQSALLLLGYLKGTPTGMYDATTARAVLEYQKANNITADGAAGSAVGAATLASLAKQGGATGGAPAQLSIRVYVAP